MKFSHVAHFQEVKITLAMATEPQTEHARANRGGVTDRSGM